MQWFTNRSLESLLQRNTKDTATYRAYKKYFPKVVAQLAGSSIVQSELRTRIHTFQLPQLIVIITIYCDGSQSGRLLVHQYTSTFESLKTKFLSCFRQTKRYKVKGALRCTVSQFYGVGSQLIVIAPQLIVILDCDLWNVWAPLLIQMYPNRGAFLLTFFL